MQLDRGWKFERRCEREGVSQKERNTRRRAISRERTCGRKSGGGGSTSHFGRDILGVDALAGSTGVVEKAADHVVVHIVLDVPLLTHTRIDASLKNTTRPDVRVVAAHRFFNG